jgi:hypothetical protein
LKHQRAIDGLKEQRSFDEPAQGRIVHEQYDGNSSNSRTMNGYGFLFLRKEQNRGKVHHVPIGWSVISRSSRFEPPQIRGQVKVGRKFLEHDAMELKIIVITSNILAWRRRHQKRQIIHMASIG